MLVPDQFPDRGYFYRSDQFNFAKIGVPALYFDNGYGLHRQAARAGASTQHEEWEEHVYHQPSDEIDDTWVFDGMIEDAIDRLLGRLARRAGRCDADVESGR